MTCAKEASRDRIERRIVNVRFPYDRRERACTPHESVSGCYFMFQVLRMIVIKRGCHVAVGVEAKFGCRLDSEIPAHFFFLAIYLGVF